MSVLLSAPVARGQGLRQGFVWSVGLGAAPLAHWSIDQFNGEGGGPAVRGMVGSLASRRNVLGLEAHFAMVSRGPWGDAPLTHGFVGPVWYHYYGRPGSSLITSVGIGLSDLDANLGENGADFCYGLPGPPNPRGQWGIGGLAGIGYEFSRNWQGMTYFSIGQPNAERRCGDQTYPGAHRYRSYFVSLVISWISD
jgi:hypothetical protein